MKVILYMAVSADGYVATKDGDSNWVSEVDLPIFEGKIKKAGCIVMGRRTFDQYRGELFPKKGVLNIILTSREPVSHEDDNVVYVHTPFEAIKKAEEEGFRELLLIGGGTVNGSFIREDLIDEIYLDIHPLILGEGIGIFENFDKKKTVELLDSRNLDKGQVILHYKVS